MRTCQFSKMTRILCLILSFIMIAGCLTGCKKAGMTDPENSAAQKGSDKEADTVEMPVAVFSVDIDCITAPDEDAEVVQTLKLKSSEEISESLTADDVTLKDAFENMTVTSISNDAETITLTISGVPKIDGASTLADVGTIAFAGKYFDSDAPVDAGVPVICMSGESAERCYFYPFYDAVIDNESSRELHIVLRAYNGSFSDGLGTDRLTLGGVLKDAEIVSFQPADNDYELVVNIRADLNNYGTESTFGTVTLAPGSMRDSSGQANADEISYTRDYSAETQGRGLSGYDLARIKETVHPKKDTPEILKFDDIGTLFNYGTMASNYYGTAVTAYQGITSMLGAFGLMNKGTSAEERRHQEIMEALSSISGQINAMQQDVTAIRSYVVDIKRMMEDLSLIAIEDSLAEFHTHYDAMIKCTNEISDALVDNSEAILALAESYYVEDEEERKMSKEELYKVFQQFGKEICKMDQSNFNTIGTKMQDLEKEYTAAMTYMKNDGSNPISRFCQKYQFIDNFSTTSLIEKEIYALDLECQFDRTLSYLMLLGGRSSQRENAELFIHSYFPDVVAEATDAEGHPYCYLLRHNARLLVDVANNLYKSSKSDNFTVLNSEDVQTFYERMQGRSLKEELVLAGFDESEFMNQYTQFSDSDFGSGGGCTTNDRIRGLGFSFKKVYGNYPYGRTPKTWYGRMDGIFNYMKDDKNSFTICSEGICYNSDYDGYYGQITTIPSCGYISKGGSWYTKGWYIIEPLTYLVRV